MEGVVLVGSNGCGEDMGASGRVVGMSAEMQADTRWIDRSSRYLATFNETLSKWTYGYD